MTSNRAVSRRYTEAYQRSSAWDRANPVGTEVMLLDSDPPEISRTSSRPWVVGDDVVVLVDGRDKALSVDSVRPLSQPEILAVCPVCDESAEQAGASWCLWRGHRRSAAGEEA